MASSAYSTAPTSIPFSMRSILAPLIAIIMGMFMVILDTTAVNVALPTLVRTFKTDLHSLQWIITGYTLAQAAVIPLAGWLSDRYGAKRLFLTAVTLFVLGSALCATAQSGSMLIVFRVLQGLGGGFVMPVGMAYTYRLSPPDKRGVVMGTIAIPILFAPALGPTVAGWLVEYVDWRWIFLINLPVGVLAVLVGLRRLPYVERHAVASLDMAGIILGPLAFAAISYGVSEGATSWTSVNTLGGLAVGAAALIAFTLVELNARQPLLELRVFRSRDFTLAIVTQWMVQISLFGGIFLLPLFLQQIRGFGAFDTGLILMAQALTAAAFMPIGGRIFDRIGVRPLVIAGLILSGGGTFLMAHLSATTDGRSLILPLILRGAGMALMMMPLNTHVLNAAPRQLVGRVTSLTQALQNVVSSLSIAGLSTILTSRASYHTATAHLQAARPHATAGSAQAAQDGHLPDAIANLFASAFNDTLIVMAAASVLGILLGMTLRRNFAAQQAEAPKSVQREAPALEMAAG